MQVLQSIRDINTGTERLSGWLKKLLQKVTPQYFEEKREATVKKWRVSMTKSNSKPLFQDDEMEGESVVCDYLQVLDN